jgi:hypothetical protein
MPKMAQVTDELIKRLGEIIAAQADELDRLRAEKRRRAPLTTKRLVNKGWLMKGRVAALTFSEEPGAGIRFTGPLDHESELKRHKLFGGMTGRWPPREKESIDEAAKRGAAAIMRAMEPRQHKYCPGCDSELVDGECKLCGVKWRVPDENRP